MPNNPTGLKWEKLISIITAIVIIAISLIAVWQREPTIKSHPEHLSEGVVHRDLSDRGTAPVLGRISKSETEYGFVVIDAGRSADVLPGMKFSVLRNGRPVGEIEVQESFDTESIADVIDPYSTHLKQSDEVVEFNAATR